MSAVTTPHFAAPSKDAVPAIPFGTLTRVELRKMVDTRAGRWLLISVTAVMAGVLLVAIITGDAGTRSFANLFALAQLPMAVLLPVVGILAATSEWSQRTVLTTFALVPSRGRVLGAKVLASVVLALVAVVVTVVAAAIFAAVAPAFGPADSVWSISADEFLEGTLFQVLNMLLGVALGTLLLNSALAIVLNFVLPTIWSSLTAAIAGLHGAQDWLDTGTTWARLIDTDLSGLSGEQWAQAGTTALLWIALPMALGFARVLRKEVD